MKLDAIKLDGGKAGSVELDDAIFGITEIRGDILQRVVRWQLAARQAGTHKTQSRSEVSRTTAKFGNQKGGGARHGSRNAPIFVGGAVAHGPRVRSHAHSLPKRLRKLGLMHALSAKVQAGKLVVLDAAVSEDCKTKTLRTQFGNLGLEKALIIDGPVLDGNFVKAARNIPNVDVLPVQGLNVYDVLRRDTLVVTRAGIEGIAKRIAGEPLTASVFSAENFVDDIQLIDGIGPKARKALAAEGVETLTAYVALSAADRAALLDKLGVSDKAAKQEWMEQCAEMISGEAPRAKVDRDLAAKILAKNKAEGA